MEKPLRLAQKRDTSPLQGRSWHIDLRPARSASSPHLKGGVARRDGVVMGMENVIQPIRQHTMARHLFLFILFPFILATTGCQKDKIYEVQEETILPPNANKTKLKSDQQYIAILYANLFQTALSSDNLFEASECVQSIGDKDLVHEVLISNYMNTGGVVLPTNAEMRADIDAFLTATYNRFLVRNPTEAERQFFKNYINTHPNVRPELVYFSFALSDEYQYY